MSPQTVRSGLVLPERLGPVTCRHSPLASGECLQVTGPNGSGKTSLLRTLSALMDPEEGRVLWRGRDVRADLAAFHGALAYLGHEPPLKGEVSAREHLRYWIGGRRRIG